MNNMKALSEQRKRLFDMIEEHLKIDNHCKKYEGEMVLHMPSYFKNDLDYCDNWKLTIDCYVIGPNRHYELISKNLKGLVKKLTRMLDEWEKEHNEWVIHQRNCNNATKQWEQDYN